MAHAVIVLAVAPLNTTMTLLGPNLRVDDIWTEKICCTLSFNLFISSVNEDRNKLGETRVTKCKHTTSTVWLMAS